MMLPLLPIPHTNSLVQTIRIILVWILFIFFAHAFSQQQCYDTLALTLTYSLLSLCSATLRYVRCAGALACSRMCAFDDFFLSSTQPHRISRPFSLSLCSFLVHVCAFVNKTYPKTAIHRETHTMTETREKKITGTQMGMGMCACDSRETE